MKITKAFLERIQSNDPTLPKLLSFAYEKLTIADIKALAEALRENTYFTALDLSGTELNDEGVILIAKLPIITSLVIAGNNISEHGILVLAQNKIITSLDISYNPIGARGVIALAKSTVLTSLNMSGIYLNNAVLNDLANNTSLTSLVLIENLIDNEGAIILAQNYHLTALNLTNNEISDKGVKALARHPKLTSLAMCHNKISIKGALALAQNDVLLALDIRNNEIGSDGAKFFINNTKLISLKVASNKINDWGVIALVKNTSLTSLDVSYNQIGDGGVRAFLNNQNLTHLNLSYNQVTPEGAKILAQHPKLNWLDISHNILGDKGAEILAASNSLNWLNITGNQIGPEGVEGFSKSTILTTLIISCNSIEDEGAITLAKNSCLQELFMSYSNIGDAGAAALAQNKTLVKLCLNYNYIHEVGQRALSENKTLKLLEVSHEQPPEFTSENLSNTFLLSQDFLCIRSLKGRMEFFNPAFSRALGYFDDELLNKSYYEFLHPSDRLKEDRILASEHKFPILYHENRYRCKDGSYLSIRWSSQTKHNRIYAVGTDITRQKLAERNMQKKDKEMESELIKSKAIELYTKDQAEFIAHLCHEIRNPLSGIYGNIQIIEEKLGILMPLVADNQLAATSPKDLVIDISNCLKDIDICAKYQKSILDDNLDMAKLTEKKFMLAIKPFDLKKSIQEIVDMFKANANLKGLRITANLPEQDCLIKGDVARVKQIIINLVSNAIKFTSPGGHIDIGLTIRDQSSDFTRFELSVADTGIGLDDQEIANLFKRFTQASSSVGNDYGGSGLGLLITKNLVELMGGNIIVKSKKGEGTIFKCSIQFENLSVEEKKQLGKEKLTTENAKPLQFSRAVRVLIVEDNVINRKILQHVLQNKNYELMEACDGQEAIEKYKSWQPDIVLMDIVMPIMNGIEATQIIRKYEQEKNLPKTPIIALTGNALEEQRATVFKAGVDDYEVKPYKKETLLQKINDLLMHAKLSYLPQQSNPDEQSSQQELIQSKKRFTRAKRKRRKHNQVAAATIVNAAVASALGRWQTYGCAKVLEDERQSAQNIIVKTYAIRKIRTEEYSALEALVVTAISCTSPIYQFFNSVYHIKLDGADGVTEERLGAIRDRFTIPVSSLAPGEKTPHRLSS